MSKRPFVLKLTDENAEYLYERYGFDMKSWSEFINSLIEATRRGRDPDNYFLSSVDSNESL